MTQLETLLEELSRPARNPREAVLEEMKRTGRKAVGCFLGFIPEELADAAGFLPVGVWGQETEILNAQRYFPAFFCAPVMQVLEHGMRGDYDGVLSAMVMPVYCDALRSAGQNFRVAVPDIPVCQIVYPANRGRVSGKKFLAAEFRKTAEFLAKVRESGDLAGECPSGGQLSEDSAEGRPSGEQLSGDLAEERPAVGQPSGDLAGERPAGGQSAGGRNFAIPSETLEESIRVYNRFRQAMRDFLLAAGRHPEIVTPTLRHFVVKSSYYSEKRNFTGLLEQLTGELNKLPGRDWSGAKVILTGIYLESEEILKELESGRFAVVSDRLLQESLQFQTDVPSEADKTADACYRLACRFAGVSCCSVAMDPKKERADRLAEEARREGAGVVVCIPSFCDPEEYDYPILKKAFEAAGVRHICLELNADSASAQAKTRIQALAEIVES